MLNQSERNALYPPFRQASGQPQSSEIDARFQWLEKFINRTIGATFLSSRILDNGRWWVMFKLDISSSKVWNVIQEYAHICYGRVQGVSLPLRFSPFATSPENGDPAQNLLWRIECYDGAFSPDDLVAELGSSISKSIVKWPPEFSAPGNP